MSILGIILLSISLSIDALGVGISYGLRKISIPLLSKAIILSISILFTTLAILIGNLILNFISYDIAKIIGSAMLLLLGIFIILQAVLKNDDNEKNDKPKVFLLNFKTISIAIQIIRNPTSCDFDKSMSIDVIEAIYLATALSIDSFGAGICSSITGMNSLFIPLAVGFCQLLFLCVGKFLGEKLYLIKNLNSKFFIVTSGTIMIILACIRYFFS